MRKICDIVEALEDQHHSWDRLFREIKLLSSPYHYSCKVARLQENRSKNRYRDVSPYDHSRVKLIAGTNDYINSSLIKMGKADRKYILTQGPLPETSGQFWQMVWEQNSKAVIMLNKVIEKGAKKCHQYFPLEKNLPLSYAEEGFEISLVNETDKSNFIIREFELCNLRSVGKRVVFQFHYIAWPDFGVPESPTTFLDFLACVRSYDVLDSNHGPVVVHCSAGIGRSGTFALVDTCLVYLEKGIEFDIRDTLMEMRTCRMGLIQTAQQLRFSYLAIAECERKLQAKQIENSSSEESDNEDDFQPPSPHDGNHSSGDGPNDSDQKDDKREAKKRRGETNGPYGEKREKLDDCKDSNLIIAGIPTHCKDNDNDKLRENLRNRRNERNAALRQKVAVIQEKMRLQERKWPWKHYIVGGLVASVVIGLAFRYYYRV